MIPVEIKGCQVISTLLCCSNKAHNMTKYLNNIAYSGLPTLSILAQSFAWLVSHFLQKFLSNSPRMLLPGTKAFPRLNATCKPLGLVPPESTLTKKKSFFTKHCSRKHFNGHEQTRNKKLPFGVFWVQCCEGGVAVLKDLHLLSHQSLLLLFAVSPLL